MSPGRRSGAAPPVRPAGASSSAASGAGGGGAAGPSDAVGPDAVRPGGAPWDAGAPGAGASAGPGAGASAGPGGGASAGPGTGAGGPGAGVGGRCAPRARWPGPVRAAAGASAGGTPAA